MSSSPASFLPAQECEVRVESLAYGGAGVARLEGFVIFVPGLVPGDRARVRIRNRKTSYAEAEVVEILETSSSRVTPSCRHFGPCGGCQWMHLPYDAQLEHKRRQVVDCLARIGGIQGYTLHAPEPSPEIYGYRNKMEFTFGTGPAGLFAGLHAAGDPGRLVAISDCKIQTPAANAILAWMVEGLRSAGLTSLSSGGLAGGSATGDLGRVTVRSGDSGSRYLVIVSTREGAMPALDRLAARALTERPEICGFLRTIARSDGSEGGARLLAGTDLLTETIEGVHLTVSAGAFLQINTAQAAHLYAKVGAFGEVDSETDVLDLYCGVGAMTLLSARKARRAVGVEASAEAVQCAERNARDNHLTSARFIRSDVRRCLVDLSLGRSRPDVRGLLENLRAERLLAIVNPPRAGLGKDVAQALAALGPRRIVYVSCDPGTLARDLARLVRSGYRTTDVAPFDMFPHSYHIETVARLERTSA